MSHFTVLVRVPSTVNRADVESEVAKILAPYDENISPDFSDDTDEIVQEWENDTRAQLRLADGTLESPYEEKYRIKRPGQFGWSSDDKYKYPAGSEIIHIPLKVLYPTLAAYAESQDKIERDGRFGHMTNLRGHWDWYQIGGRWRGQIPHVASHRPIELDGANFRIGMELITTEEKVHDFTAFGLPKSDRKWEPETKAGFCDGVRLRYVDKAVCEAELEKGFGEFYDEYVQFMEGRTDWPAFEGPRGRLMEFGLLRCLQYGEFYLPPDRDFSTVAPSIHAKWRAEHAADLAEVERLRALGWKLIVWGDDTHSPGRRCDMLAPPMSREELRTLFGNEWSPLHTYAFVDAAGWRQPGRMGMFGVSHTTPDSSRTYNQEQEAWLASGDQDDWIVLVDCHT